MPKTSISSNAWPGTKIIQGDFLILAGIFILALALRVGCLLQYIHSPDFYVPVGDAQTYYQQALLIFNTGQFYPGQVPFQSPFYPLVLYLFFMMFGPNVLGVRIVQVVLGSLTCLWIYQLTREVTPTKSLAPLVAGLMAAFYAPMAFYEIQLLAISWVLFLVLGSLVLLIRYQKNRKTVLVFLSGISFGLASLDRTNLLLLVPLIGWYLFSDLRWKGTTHRYKPVLAFVGACALVFLPFVLHNVLNAKDLVLVSSNGGINFYIGNNPDADGLFHVPENTGLMNAALEQSQQTMAERTLRKKLRPSQISRFWVRRAVAFLIRNPGAAIRLYGKKLIALIHRQEIPDNIHIEYLRAYYVPFLFNLFMNINLLLPLACVGLFFFGKNWQQLSGKLLFLFFGMYTLTILLFFINARYRLPLIPFLILFAAIGSMEMVGCIRKKAWKQAVLALFIMIAMVMIMQSTYTRQTYGHTRFVFAQRFVTTTNEAGEPDPVQLRKAVLEYKQILEVTPRFVQAAYQLGYVYVQLGYYSGAQRIWSHAVAIDAQGGNPEIKDMLANWTTVTEHREDVTTEEQIPKTLLEEAKIQERAEHWDAACGYYRTGLRKDPYQVQAYCFWAEIEANKGKTEYALKILKKGLKYNPYHPLLLKSMAKAYRTLGEREKARAIEQELIP